MGQYGIVHRTVQAMVDGMRRSAVALIFVTRWLDRLMAHVGTENVEVIQSRFLEFWISRLKC